MNSLEKQQQLSKIISEIKLHQGYILEAFNNEVDEDQVLWPSLRARVIRLLGDRGLIHRIRVILGDSSGNGGAK